MKINSLYIQNFRSFPSCNIQFSPGNVTAIIGQNGTGKTTILDALAIALGGFLSGFDETKKNRHIDVEEARLALFQHGNYEAQFPVEVACKATIDNQEYEWARSLNGKKNRTTQVKPRNIVMYAQKIEKEVRANKQHAILPIIGYYGTGRLWSQIRDRKELDLFESGSRFLGYIDCLDPNSNEKLVQKWFKKMALIRFQEQAEPAVLTAVRHAVEQSLAGLGRGKAKASQVNVDFNARADEVLVHFDGELPLPVRKLSDGYRTLIGVIADIAFRMGVLNPDLGERVTQETPGIVLIDEIDLHLHPLWQRDILKVLREIFPRVQFIVTTHSPFIIQSLEEREILVLEDVDLDDQIDATLVTGKFNEMSIEDLAEEIMDIPMPQWSKHRTAMYQAAQEYYTLLNQMEHADPTELEKLRDKLNELSRPFTHDIAFTAFLDHKRQFTESKRKEQNNEARE